MHKYANYSVVSLDEINDKRFLDDNKAKIIDDEDIEVEVAKTNFNGTYGAFFKYTPDLSKEEQDNLEYWDQEGNVRNDPESMLYYQDYKHEVQANEVIVETMARNFTENELIALFKGEVTRLSTKDAKINNGPAAHNDFMKDQHVYLDLIRGNDPYFTQLKVGEFNNIIEDAVYILWDMAPFNTFTLSPKYVFKDEQRKIDIFVFYCDEDDDYKYESLPRLREYLEKNYKYRLVMLGQGSIAWIFGLNKIIKDMADDESVIVKLPDQVVYFMAKVKDIKASPTGGSMVNFIWDHDEDGEDYGYYY